MRVLKDNFTIKIKSFINERSGFTLVEIMIAVLLIGFVLSMGFMLFLFGVSSQQIGGEQTNVQQNARMAGDFISKELRMAEKSDILEYYDKDLTPEALKIFLGGDDDYPEDDGIGYDFEEDHNVYFIFEHGGSIYHQKVSEGETETELLEGISRDIDFDLEFKLGDKDKTVEIEIYATDKQGGRSYHLETEVLMLNVDKIEVDEAIPDGEGGKAIVYQIPAPPEPSMRVPSINPSSMIYGSEDDIEVTVRTERVDDGQSVTAEFRKEDRVDSIPVSITGDLEIEGNVCSFTFDLPDLVNEGLYFGNDYYVEVNVDTVDYSRRSLFRVLPDINIDIEEFPSSEHWGDVTITTLGVPHETIVDVELYYIDDTTDEEVQVVFVPQSVGPGYYDNENLLIQEFDDKKGELEFRINEEELEDKAVLEKDLFLRVTIGDTIKVESMSTFIIDDINIEDKGYDDILVTVETSGDVSKDYKEVTINLRHVTSGGILNYGSDTDGDFIIHDGKPENQAETNKMTFNEDGSLDAFHIELTNADYYGDELKLELLFEAVNESIFSDEFTIVKTE